MYDGVRSRTSRGMADGVYTTDFPGVQRMSPQTFDVEGAPLLSRSPPQPGTVDWRMTSILFLFPAMGGLLYGFDIGASSGALVSITTPATSGTLWREMSTLRSGTVVSSSLLGALLGSLAALLWGQALGRRKELLMAAWFYGGGSALVGIAPSYSIMIAGRVLYGIGIGFAMHAAPAYIAETSPAHVRGLMISLKEGLVVVGILLGYVVSFVFVNTVGGWRWMYGLGALPALALGCGMLFLPESPRWLMLAGRGHNTALRALLMVKGKAGTRAQCVAELESIVAALAEDARGAGGGEHEAGGSGAGSLAGMQSLQVGGPFLPSSSSSPLPPLTADVMTLFQRQYRRPLMAGICLMLFQQITGQPSVLYYAASIFKAAGFSSSWAATGVSLALGNFKLLMTCVAVLTVDSLGRRPLLLGGVGALVFSLVLLWACAGGVLPLGASGVAWTSLGGLLLYVGAYQLSFGPLSWLIVGEVFPLRVRSQAIALATLVNFSANFVVSLALPIMQRVLGVAATYGVFTVIGFFALGVIYLIIPETKGKSLEEIEAMWKRRRGDKRARSNTPD